MEVPKLDKVVINMGVGEAKDNAKVLESAIADLGEDRRTESSCYKSKKSVANFKNQRGYADRM